MQVCFRKALEVFERFRKEQQAPTLHPYYVTADAKRDGTLNPVFFVYEEKEDMFYYGFHKAYVQETDCYDIQSPYGYNGPISSSADKGFLDRAWRSYLSWCDENMILAEFIRFNPLVENWRYYPGEVIDNRETVWINLGNRELMPTYSTRVRTAIRKAIKNGLHVEWWESHQFLKVFPELYNTTMKELNADQFYYFTDKYYQEVTTWNQAHLAVCKFQGKIVAAAIFLAGPYIMEYHLSASDSLGKKLGATNLLLHEAALFGQLLGCGALHLGGGTDSSPDNSLLFFKSGFSKLHASFKIGKLIHRKEDYEALKLEWQKKHGKLASKVLFYRF